MSEPDRPDRPSGPDAGWEAAVQEFFRDRWAEATHIDHRGRWTPPTWAQVAMLTVVLAVLVFAVIPLITWAARGIAGLGERGFEWMSGLDLARMAYEPVNAWIAAHAAGAGMEASFLTALWWITVASAFGLAWLFRVTAARIGWCAAGVAACAMAWQSTPDEAEAVVTGIVAFWWLVGSVFALRRASGIPESMAASRDQREPSIKRQQLERACDVLDQVADVFDPPGKVNTDPRAASISSSIRGRRVAILSEFQYAFADVNVDNRESLAGRMALFTRVTGTGSETELPAEVFSMWQDMLVEASARRLFDARRDLAAFESPVEELAATVAWLWQCDRRREVVDLVERWWRYCRSSFGVWGTATEPVPRLGEVVAALERSWAPGLSDADRDDIAQAVAARLEPEDMLLARN